MLTRTIYSRVWHSAVRIPRKTYGLRIPAPICRIISLKRKHMCRNRAGGRQLIAARLAAGCGAAGQWQDGPLWPSLITAHPGGQAGNRQITWTSSRRRGSRGFRLSPIGNLDSWPGRLANTQWYR